MTRDTISFPIRLGALPVPAKIMLTLYLFLVSAGYGVALLNVFEHNSERDLEPGLSLDDIRAAYRGFTKLPKPPVETAAAPGAEPGDEKGTEKGAEPPAASGVSSPMLKAVLPGGIMRKYLDKGGEPAVNSLVKWLQAGSKEEDFEKEGVFKEGDPSVADVLSEQCIRCHNARSGKKKDIPYAATATGDPEYAMVAKQTVSSAAAAADGKPIVIEPMGRADLIQSTHAHILAIPVFTLIVGCLFFLTRQRPVVKAILGPLPMIGVIMDIGGWWLARIYEPGIYLIAGAGGVFGGSLALQILCILGSLWLGGRGKAEPAAAGDPQRSSFTRLSSR